MIQRTLIMGSEWLYFKLYTGLKSADRILEETILPFTEYLLNNKIIDEWFFIRYSDPKFHLRVRLKLCSGGSFDVIMSLFYKMFNPLVNNGILINLLIDCYQRELERYGEKSMLISEEYFFVDSVAISKIIARLRETDDSDETRWLLGISLINDTLIAAGYGIEEKLNFIESVNTEFCKEFGIESTMYTKPLNLKYRDNRKKIDDIIAHNGVYKQYADLLIERQQQLSIVFNKLNDCGGYAHEQLIPHYTHMTINRLFRSNNRLCEMVVYYLMNKHYSSYIAYGNIKNTQNLR